MTNNWTTHTRKRIRTPRPAFVGLVLAIISHRPHAPGSCRRANPVPRSSSCHSSPAVATTEPRLRAGPSPRSLALPASACCGRVPSYTSKPSRTRYFSRSHTRLATGKPRAAKDISTASSNDSNVAFRRRRPCGKWSTPSARPHTSTSCCSASRSGIAVKSQAVGPRSSAAPTQSTRQPELESNASIILAMPYVTCASTWPNLTRHPRPIEAAFGASHRASNPSSQLSRPGSSAKPKP